jgi:hypothetical protein
MRMDRVAGGLQVGGLSSIYALSFVMAGLDPAIHVFTNGK